MTFSATDLAERRARLGSRTEIARVLAKTGAELEADIAGDPDFRDQPVN